MGSLDTPVSQGRKESFVTDSAFSQPGLIIQTMLPNGTVVTSFQGKESIFLTAGCFAGHQNFESERLCHTLGTLHKKKGSKQPLSTFQDLQPA